MTETRLHVAVAESHGMGALEFACPRCGADFAGVGGRLVVLEDGRPLCPDCAATIPDLSVLPGFDEANAAVRRDRAGKAGVGAVAQRPGR